MGVALLAPAMTSGEVVMTPHRIAGPFLALAVFFMSPGSAVAGSNNGVAAYEQGDYESSFREFMPLAVAGDSRAQTLVGLMYLGGTGVPQNPGEAVRWFRLAANQGDAEAQSLLGAMYADGRGVPQNEAEAVRLYRLAANQGHAEAQHNLGRKYAEGRGVPQDEAQAVRWFRLAANQGNRKAQAWLGLMYAQGRGVLQHDAEALRWIRLSADQGDPSGQLLLGGMYADGQGVSQDNVLAYMWLNLAAGRATGDLQEDAVELRDKVAGRLSRAQRARGQELARNWRPGDAARSEGRIPSDSVTGRSQHRPAERQVGSSPFQAELERRAERDREVQQLLTDLGYDPGPVDGAVGPRTRAAIRAFQADVGLPVDGQVSDQLQAALTDAVSSGPSVAARSAPTPLRLEATGTGFAVDLPPGTGQ